MNGHKSLVQRIERKLEATVGDAVARVFGGAIVPQEIDAVLRREAADGVQSLPGNRLLAPNDYLVSLSRDDFATLGADQGATADAFACQVADFINDRGWQTYGEVIVRFEQSENLHTGQFRAHGSVNPDADPHPMTPEYGRSESDNLFGAEPGVLPMTDNSSYRGQGQGRPDEYHDEGYGRPHDSGPQQPGSSAAYPPEQYPYAPEQGGYPPQPGYPLGRHEQGGYPGPAGYPDQRGYPPYEQHGHAPAPHYGAPAAPAAPGYEQGYPPAAGYSPAVGGGQPGYGSYPPPGQPEHIGYGAGYPAANYGGPDYGQYQNAPVEGGYAPPAGGYAEPADQGYAGYQPAAPTPDYRGSYAPREHLSLSGALVTLQLDDGSGRTYQLRDGSNVVGRGQDAQFRLPDTGVSRRHLEIRWDGTSALLSDLNSTNGTTVNNAPVQEWQLADGDVIRLGHSEIIVQIH